MSTDRRRILLGGLERCEHGRAGKQSESTTDKEKVQRKTSETAALKVVLRVQGVHPFTPGNGRNASRACDFCSPCSLSLIVKVLRNDRERRDLQDPHGSEWVGGGALRLQQERSISSILTLVQVITPIMLQ